jgi:hypothetical protein
MTNSEKFDPVPAVQISWVEGKLHQCFSRAHWEKRALTEIISPCIKQN